MFKKSIVLIFAVCLLLSGTTAFADGKKVSPALTQKLEAVNTMLNGIESHISRIESQTMVAAGDSENLEKQMYAYAAEMKAALDIALKETQKAGETKGKEGFIDSLASFEDTAKRHEQRTAMLETKFKQFEEKIKNGQIKLDMGVLQQMSPSERQEFFNFLTPEAQKNIQKMHPMLFGKIKTSSLGVGTLMGLIERSDFPNSVGMFCSSIPARISDFIVSPAEASLAYTCLPSCGGLPLNWGGCVSCVLAAGPNAVNAWNNFNACWNGACACKFSKPMCCVKKAACLAAFIKKLA